MREAIGGTMLMYIVLFFLMIYIVFMAVVINYGRVFRVKNSIVSFIENEEGFKENISTDKVVQLASSMGYNGDIYVCYTLGNNNTYYYSVKVFISFKLPMVDNDFQIPITGETSAVRQLKGSNAPTENIYECNTTEKDKDRFQGRHNIAGSRT